MTLRAIDNNLGFSLIEVIVSIVVAAILGTILIQFTGTNLSRSAETISTAESELLVRRTMENITRDYRNWLRTSPGEQIAAFKTIAESHQGGRISVQTSSAGFEIDPGNDGDIELLLVTVTVVSETDPSNRSSIRSVFTK